MSDCIEHTVARASGGYGNSTITLARNYKALIRPHRFVWWQHHGEIPDGMYICHTCDNPACINIDHLFLGSSSDNARDMMAKGRGTLVRVNAEREPITHCKRGHELSGDNLRIYMRPDGYQSRVCIACQAARNAARYT